MRVLFVCSGNICRSPFAEELARVIEVLPDIEFASAGTIAVAGGRATAAAIAAAAAVGVDLQAHRATLLTPAVAAGADVVYGMEAEHVDRVHALSPGTRVGLLHPDGVAIPDPYGGSRADYKVSYTLIREALEQRLREPAKRPGAGERKPPMLGG